MVFARRMYTQRERRFRNRAVQGGGRPATSLPSRSCDAFLSALPSLRVRGVGWGVPCPLPPRRRLGLHPNPASGPQQTFRRRCLRLPSSGDAELEPRCHQQTRVPEHQPSATHPRQVFPVRSGPPCAFPLGPCVPPRSSRVPCVTDTEGSARRQPQEMGFV